MGSSWELETPQGLEHPQGFEYFRKLGSPKGWKPHREYRIAGNLGAEHLWGFGDAQELEILQGDRDPTRS